MYKYLVLISFLLFSCMHITEEYYCDDSRCKSGIYVFRESSPEFKKNISKDSSNYKAKILKDEFEEDKFNFLDSVINTGKIFSKKEKNILNSANVISEEIKAPLYEHSTKTSFRFRNLKELHKFRKTLFTYKFLWYSIFAKLDKKTSIKYKGVLDTIQNVKLFRSVLDDELNRLVFKGDQLFYIKNSMYGNLVEIEFPLNDVKKIIRISDSTCVGKACRFIIK